MELTESIIKEYIGGQLEVQNEHEEYLYRGEINKALLENNGFMVGFSWLAKGEGFPPAPEKWVNIEPKDYEIDLDVYTALDIGNERICLSSSIIGETTVLFPPSGSRLDPSKVEGLVLED